MLLLEAGDEEPEVAEVPALAPLLQGSSVDWNYRTQPEEHACRSRREQGCYWARGKVMGGSSTINYMIYMRGHPQVGLAYHINCSGMDEFRGIISHFPENNEKIKKNITGGVLSPVERDVIDRIYFRFISTFFEIKKRDNFVSTTGNIFCCHFSLETMS